MLNSQKLTELEGNLHQQIKKASENAKTPLSSEEVTDIVREVLATLSGDITVADLKFYAELEELAGYIRSAKKEIAAIKPKEISMDHIPHATDELDAVVGATEEATNKIMDVCDVISGIAEKCSDEAKQELIDCTTRIFEACNFQDITGQRITKVVQTLKHIDVKVEALLAALGEEIHPDSLREQKEAALSDEDLLNGPQLPSNAIDQAEIDRLLGEF